MSQLCRRANKHFIRSENLSSGVWELSWETYLLSNLKYCFFLITHKCGWFYYLNFLWKCGYIFALEIPVCSAGALYQLAFVLSGW